MATSRVNERRTRRRNSYSELESREEVTPELNVSEVRRIRIERLESTTTTRRSEATPDMPSESNATLPSLKSRSIHRRKKERQHHSSDEETKHRRRRKSTVQDARVYGSPVGKSQSRITISGTKGVEEVSGDSEDDSTKSEPVEHKPRKRRIKIVYVDEGEYKSSKPKVRRSRTDQSSRERPRHGEEFNHRSRASQSRRHSVVEKPPISSHKR